MYVLSRLIGGDRKEMPGNAPQETVEVQVG